MVMKYTGPEGAIHQPKRIGDVGYDLECQQDEYIAPGQIKYIPTGVNVALPDGYWGFITNRSSTEANRGLRVVPGVIDWGYTGPLLTGVHNYGEEPAFVREGDRLAQLILFPVSVFGLEHVHELPHRDRGDLGFGSTG